MPLGTPEQLNTFLLAGYQLTAIAPEELEEGVQAVFRFFWYKGKDPEVQAGRVIPSPMRLRFKITGPDALQATKFLRAITEAQQPIDLSWTDRHSYAGRILEYRATYTQHVVQGELIYQPTKDKNKLGGTKPPDPAQRSMDAQDAMNNATQANTDLGVSLLTIRDLVADQFSHITNLTSAVQDALSTANDALIAAGDLLMIPWQTAGEINTTINQALALIPAARGELFDRIFAPATPLIQGTADFLARAAAQAGLVAMDDLEMWLPWLSSSLAPTPLPYTVQAGDTLEVIASWFDTTIAVLLQLNPGLSEATLTAGAQVQVPHG